MIFKKIGKALIFPHIAIMIMLVPVSAVFLVYSMIFLGVESPIAIASYVISAYTLTVWCVRIPHLIAFFREFKSKNKYALRWQNDAQLRVNVSLYGTLVLNTGFAVFQLGLGFWHRSFWFHSLALYYIFLAVMRFFLVRYTSKHSPGENMRAELIKYRACGIVLLIMNVALALITFFMVYLNKTFIHHKITAIAMAAYTFTSFILAIINLVKYRKYNSPVYSASKIISLAATCVSMLTLEATMLTAFGDPSADVFLRKILLGVSGGVISAFIIVVAVYMIVQGTKNIRLLKSKGVS